MGGYGGERVTLALLSYPVRMQAGSYLATLPAVIREREREKASRLYLADRLLQIEINTARLFGGGYSQKRLREYLEPPREEKRTAEEVVGHIRKKLAEVRK